MAQGIFLADLDRHCDAASCDSVAHLFLVRVISQQSPASLPTERRRRRLWAGEETIRQDCVWSEETMSEIRRVGNWSLITNWEYLIVERNGRPIGHDLFVDVDRFGATCINKRKRALFHYFLRHPEIRVSGG